MQTVSPQGGLWTGGEARSPPWMPPVPVPWLLSLPLTGRGSGDCPGWAQAETGTESPEPISPKSHGLGPDTGASARRPLCVRAPQHSPPTWRKNMSLRFLGVFFVSVSDFLLPALMQAGNLVRN